MERNKKQAESLRALADVYDKTEADLMPQSLTFYVDTKSQLLAALKAVGGKFTKTTTSSESWARLIFTSARIEGVRISIDRDKVCRKIVTFECEPVLSPEDEAEILDVAA